MQQLAGQFTNPFEITPGPIVTPSIKAPIVTRTALVVDTNILLKQVHLRELLKIDQATFDSNYDVFTLDAVINEVKDANSRAYIEHKLPYKLQVKSADHFLDKKDIVRVENFAKDTGDWVGLSKVDMLVISLGLKLAQERGENHLVR